MVAARALIHQKPIHQKPAPRGDRWPGYPRLGAAASLDLMSQPAEPPRPRRRTLGLSGYVVAVAFFGLSLTPSLLPRSPVMVPIPGTSSVAHLEDNMKAADIELTSDEVEELEQAV